MAGFFLGAPSRMQPNRFTDKLRQAWRQLFAEVAQKPFYLVFFLVLLAGFLAGTWYSSHKGGQAAIASGRHILHYVDPMNPAHTSPEPGLAPCGMKMTPVYADDGGQTDPLVNLPPGTVKITPRKQQLIGVKLGVVEKAPFTHTFRALGTVAIDETRIYRINAFVDGWILKTFDNSTGSLVMKDQELAAFYSRDFISAEQAYLYALSTLDRIKKGDQLVPNQLIGSSSQIRGAAENLENLGMSKTQIQELAQTRRLTQDIYLRAPVTSFVLARNVSPGQKISKSEELFKLADLSRVWVVANLYENEAQFVRPGTRVRVIVPYQRHTLWATVTDIQPEFDKVSRTLKVRLETDNPNYRLRPDMFVDVEFPINLPATVSLPVDAVLDSGLKQTVFVERGNGCFEPRKVETGWRLGDRVEITKGLTPGEHIVISGNFLIDSESRMSLAAAGMFGEVIKDPVCGLNVDEVKSKAAGFQSTFKNQTFYFCSKECQKHFDKHPERYSEKDAGVDKKPEAPVMAKDPVCGIAVDKAQAKAAGLTSEQGGETSYFCSYSCNNAFDKDPERYLKQEAEGSGANKQVMPANAQDPVCGKDVDPAKATAQYLKRAYKGKTYYFCRDDCSQRFDQAPERYALKAAGVPVPGAPPENLSKPGDPIHSQLPSAPGEKRKDQNQTPAPEKDHYLVKALGLDGYLKMPNPLKETPATDRDPVCGVKMGEDVAGALAYKTPYKGKLYFFCTEECKRAFDRDPESYVSKLAAAPAPPASSPAPGATTGPATPAMSKDPVCGKAMKSGGNQPSPYQTVYKGQTYEFCSDQCKKAFEQAPERYVNTAVGAVSVPPQSVQPLYPTGSRFKNVPRQYRKPRPVAPPTASGTEGPQ